MQNIKTTAKLVVFSFFLFNASVFFPFSSLAKVEAVIGSLPLEQNLNLGFELPLSDASEILISREQYLISYNKEHRTPNWVAWKLENKNFGKSGRSNNFHQDEDLEAYLAKTDHTHAVTPEEYKNSCFDRGHQAPSADRTDKAENNSATFAMSNMVPQTPYLNRGLWEHLESYTRAVVREGKVAYIIAGPIYDQNFGAIGPQEDIRVPSKNYKVIVFLEPNQSPKDINQNTEIISVIMPNTEADGSIPKVAKDGTCKTATQNRGAQIQDLNTADWEKYKTDLSEVERLAEIKFNFR